MAKFQNNFDQAIWRVVSNIAKGSVMSYGDVARAAGYPRHARMVSKAMSRSEKSLPWYRVIKSNHKLAFEVGTGSYNKQRSLLEKEGVQFIKEIVCPVNVDVGESLDELIWGPE